MDRPSSEWNLTRNGKKSLKLTETEGGPNAAGSDFFFTNATLPIASIYDPGIPSSADRPMMKRCRVVTSIFILFLAVIQLHLPMI